MDCFENKIPIMAYIGPERFANREKFKEFKDCGFDISLQNFDTLDQLTDYCDIAALEDVKVIGQYPAMHTTELEKASNILKWQQGFYQYFLQDEPSSSQLLTLEKEIEDIKKIDSTHGFYSNLYSYYNSNVLKLTETKTYDEYLSNAEKLETSQISFDFYPIKKIGCKVKIRDGWYSNLEKIRNMSKETKTPFWGFVLSCPHSSYPQPTIGHLRLQVYMNLAYGAQGIEYFTYWTPDDYDKYHFYNAPIEKDGTRTNTYDIVKEMNDELNSVGGLFKDCTVFYIQHTSMNILLQHTVKNLPDNVSKLVVSGTKGACVSQFIKDGYVYCMIVNKNFEDSVTVKLKTASEVRVINKDLSVSKVSEKETVKPGDCLILRLYKKK